jgi:hypothetical protein
MRNWLPIVLLALCLAPVALAVWLSSLGAPVDPDDADLAIPVISLPPHQPGWLDRVRSLLP